MRLSISLTLSLLSASHLSDTAAAFKQETSVRQRMLQKAEALSAPTNNYQQRMLNNGNGNSNGNGNGGNSNGNGNDRNSGGGGNGNGNGYGKPEKEHSGHLDANDNGITTDETDYTYGSSVAISFELTNDLVPVDVLAVLGGQDMADWKIGLFMRMADPQDGALDPIVAVDLTYVDRGRRSLQQSTDAPPGGDDETTQPTEPPEPEAAGPPPTLNYEGTATLTVEQTSAAFLDSLAYGTGFDLYLLDDAGRAIIGPGTFYMLKTEDMEAEEEARQNAVPDHPLAKFDHSKKKKGKGNTGGKGKGGGKGANNAQKPDKNIGKGSGKDGGMIIATTSSLAEYVLETDKFEYGTDEDVTVTYDLSPDIGGGGRRLQGGNGNGNGGNGNGNGNGGGNNQQTTTSSSAGPETTTTTTEATVDQGAGDGGEEPEEPEGIDPEDKTLFSVGVYMSMANPQEGALAPIISVPFCVNPEDCGSTVEELEAGQFAFGTAGLDTATYGGGFDVWILNGNGHGVAGPKTFYII